MTQRLSHTSDNGVLNATLEARGWFYDANMDGHQPLSCACGITGSLRHATRFALGLYYLYEGIVLANPLS